MKTTKNKSLISTLLAAILLISGSALGLHVITLNPEIINPGLEGPKVYLNWINFRDTVPSDWNGALNNHYLNTINSAGQVINVAETDKFINTTHVGSGEWMWWSSSQEGRPTVTWERYALGITKTFILKMDIENNIPLTNITESGNPINPLNGNGSTLQISYPTILGVDPNPDGTVTYNITNTKLILAPADFVLQFSITPAAETGSVFTSGWTEGDWKSVHLRFMLYWNTWLSSILKNVHSDTSFNDNAPNIPADALNKEEAFKYVGGFPLTAWVGEWDPVVQNNAPTGISDPIWFWRNKSPPASIPTEDLENLKAKVDISPDLKGHPVSLYSDNGVVIDENNVKTNAVDYLEAMAKTQTPDPTLTPIQYFPVDIITLGTYCTGSWQNGFTVYFPCAYLRLHIVYGLRGTFTYLWTTKTQQDLDYPGYANRTITIVRTPGALDWLTSLFNNPIFLLLLFAFLLMIILVVLAIFAPGVLSLASAAGRAGAKRLEGTKPKRRLCETHPPSFFSFCNKE